MQKSLDYQSLNPCLGRSGFIIYFYEM